MTQINKIRIEKGEITTDSKETQWILRKYYEQLHTNKMDNLDKMHKFLETYNLPKINQDESENLNKQVTSNESEAIIKTNKQTTKKPSQQAKALDQMAS